MMGSSIKVLIVCICLGGMIIAPGLVHAAPWYVDASQTSTTQDGTEWSSSFR